MNQGRESGAPPGRASRFSGTASGGDFAALAPELSKRIGEILDSVQREADRMLEQAQVQAQSRAASPGLPTTGEALVADHRHRFALLSGELAARVEGVLGGLAEAERVRVSYGRLLAALAERAEQLVRDLERESRDAATPAAPAPTSAPEGEVTATGPLPAGRGLSAESGAVRQSAAQMAMAGANRAQVDAHLRDFFGLAEREGLLDQVFGVGSDGETRVPWAIVPPAG